MYNFDQATKKLHKQIDVNVDTTGVSERIYRKKNVGKSKEERAEPS